MKYDVHRPSGCGENRIKDIGIVNCLRAFLRTNPYTDFWRGVILVLATYWVNPEGFHQLSIHIYLKHK